MSADTMDDPGRRRYLDDFDLMRAGVPAPGSRATLYCEWPSHQGDHWVTPEEAHFVHPAGRCVCIPCWRGDQFAQAGPVASTPVLLPAEASAGTDSDGDVVYIRWWCEGCECERQMAFTNLRRPRCPECDAPLRRWDEHQPPEMPFDS